MKKVLVVFIVGFVFFGCTSKNIEAQSSNDSQRIVGTWVGIAKFGSSEEYRYVFTFNSNGTFTSSNTYNNETGSSGIYFLGGLNETGLSNIFLKLDNTGAISYTIASYSISPNGRILVLSEVRDISYPGNFWLEKQ